MRLSLVLEFLRWAARPGLSASPPEVSETALSHACDLVADYFMPMAARVYGDAAMPQAERNAATLARWITKNKPPVVHVRHIQRDARLPGLRDAETIRAACEALIEADWLGPLARGTNFQKRGKEAYPVNPAIVSEGAP